MGLVVGPAVFDPDIPTFSKPGIGQTAEEAGDAEVLGLLRSAAEIPDCGHSRLLSVRRERPRGCHATKQRDELAPFHSITSSARASSEGGTSIPSALAVLRLMRNSNLVGCSTGRSPGLAPFSILSTKVAARRKRTTKLGP